jgi:hypothetical protein
VAAGAFAQAGGIRTGRRFRVTLAKRAAGSRRERAGRAPRLTGAVRGTGAQRVGVARTKIEPNAFRFAGRIDLTVKRVGPN